MWDQEAILYYKDLHNRPIWLLSVVDFLHGALVEEVGHLVGFPSQKLQKNQLNIYNIQKAIGSNHKTPLKLPKTAATHLSVITVAKEKVMGLVNVTVTKLNDHIKIANKF